MKTKIYILFFTLIFSQIVFCQNNLEDKENKSHNSLNDYSADSRYHLISQMDFKNKTKSSIEDLYRNGGLNISQIGSYNNVAVQVTAKSVDLDVLQKGDGNTFELDRQANVLKMSVVQQGQENTIKDFSKYNRNDYDVNMEFVQKGDNQNIHNYGSNSISKDMKVVQKGNGASVLIYNHK